MRKRRVRAASAIVWAEALTHLRKCKVAVLQLGALLLALTLFVNVFPRTPTWQAGFLTGVFATFFVAGTAWLAWVPSGLAVRSMGALAEAWTDETLHKADSVFSVVPSLKFANEDIDHVAITRSGVLTVETKWRAKSPGIDDMHAAAHQAARVGRKLRLSIKGQGLPEHLIDAIVVYWSPQGSDITPTEAETPFGPVTVLGGKALPGWLSSRRTGPVGPDYAESLHRQLQQLAIERDRTAIQAGRFVRWLARVQ